MTVIQGIVTSAKMQSTITVTTHRNVLHPLYKKHFRVSKKFLADTNGHEDVAVGDEVLITECRPISKRKHFKLTEVLKRAPRVSEIATEATVEKAMQRNGKKEDASSSDQ